MKYIRRDLERKFLRMSGFFKAVLVTGARQTGKTTMLKHLAQGHNRTYVSLDDFFARQLAQNDPVLFFQTYEPPLIIDEVQYAPQLFEQIKIICDRSDKTGLFWLTGSQQYSMMQNVSESLAGRIGIMTLYSMTRDEKQQIRYDTEFDFSLKSLTARKRTAGENNIKDIFCHIWQGGMPQLIAADEEQRTEYYNSYIDTYLMRDISEAGGITDMVRFRRFITACAALVSEPVNYRKLSEIAEISQPTAKEWLRLLEGLGIVYMLKPFANNQLKRLTRTPKLYFCDTGLCAYLSMWLTPEALMNGAASGHYFENYVVMELVKYYAYSPVKVNMTYYRDSNAKEIDLLIEENNSIHPVEIKKSASPDSREIRKFAIIDKTEFEHGMGGIICMCNDVIPIDRLNLYIPCNVI